VIDELAVFYGNMNTRIYLLEQHMITQENINEIKKRLINAYQPLEIYIFGSYAWGTPTDESDLDCAIIVDSSEPTRYAMLAEGYNVFFWSRSL
jgi:predicted nucleotidyltransferase